MNQVEEQSGPVVGEATVEQSRGVQVTPRTVVLPNSMNRLYFLVFFMNSIFFFLLGVIFFNQYNTTRPDKALFGVVLFWSIGSFFLVGTLWKEVIHRPTSVTIDDDGVVLKLRFGRTVCIEWSDILWISASTGAKNDGEGVSGRGGGIKAKGSVFYDLAYEVGRDIREKYVQVNGRRPLTRLQYIEARKR